MFPLNPQKKTPPKQQSRENPGIDETRESRYSLRKPQTRNSLVSCSSSVFPEKKTHNLINNPIVKNPSL
jgi:hypothetical protein